MLSYFEQACESIFAELNAELNKKLVGKLFIAATYALTKHIVAKHRDKAMCLGYKAACTVKELAGPQYLIELQIAVEHTDLVSKRQWQISSSKIEQIDD